MFLESYKDQIGVMTQESERNGLSIVLQSPKEQSALKKGSNYIPGEKSGKWSDEQHMKYIVFIDYNKQKMRSKQKRRSNKFYEEMAHFISTRNALQCRSHHQKLQEKYTHVNKIISLFKPVFHKALYKRFTEQLETITHDHHRETLNKFSVPEKVMVSVEVQTEIQDISNDMVIVNPSMVVIQNRRNMAMGQPMGHPSPAFYPPPIYSPPQGSMASMASSYPVSHLGWWGGYSPSKF